MPSQAVSLDGKFDKQKYYLFFSGYKLDEGSYSSSARHKPHYSESHALVLPRIVGRDEGEEEKSCSYDPDLTHSVSN